MYQVVNFDSPLAMKSATCCGRPSPQMLLPNSRCLTRPPFRFSSRRAEKKSDSPVGPMTCLQRSRRWSLVSVPRSKTWSVLMFGEKGLPLDIQSYKGCICSLVEISTGCGIGSRTACESGRDFNRSKASSLSVVVLQACFSSPFARVTFSSSKMSNTEPTSRSTASYIFRSSRCLSRGRGMGSLVLNSCIFVATRSDRCVAL
mmetsp:Transcript_6691/g.15287  ORF Transcript_6691/g.15287 Transcript_6691/m.15287 type:complete len:202 (-) Transcript_6691:2300-2905(-)